MPTRVMLVDDAVVVRHVLTDTLSRDPELTVVGTAADGRLALEKLPTLNPDVVVLDVEMPNMDGIETLAAIKKQYPRIKIIMFSTLTSRGAGATMDALMLGADDYVCKPANVNSIGDAVGRINEELIPRIKALHRSINGPSMAVAPVAPPAATRFTSPVSAPQRPAPTNPSPLSPLPATPVRSTTVSPPGPTQSASRPTSSTGGVPRAEVITPGRPRANTGGGKPQILAIAVSTGGPNALAAFLPHLPADLAVPIVIVQHIPPMFSKALADRLDSKSALRVSEGVAGAAVLPGEVWIAPGDFHMTVHREGSTTRIATNQGPPENSCRPAADVLFRSVVAAYGGNALGLVMTGMGNDGLKGSLELVHAGAKVIAQDEATSVVWGMPGAIVNAGIADRTLPLEQLAGEVIARVGTSQSAASRIHP